LDKSFVLSCLKRALSRQKPEIINSDQGGHFTNPDYIKLLKAALKSQWMERVNAWTTPELNGFSEP